MVHHFRTLGCLCYASVLSRSDKFGARDVKVVFMGYSNVTKGYVLYDLQKQQFFINRDVTFRETVFPFKDNQTRIKPVYLLISLILQKQLHLVLDPRILLHLQLMHQFQLSLHLQFQCHHQLSHLLILTSWMIYPSLLLITLRRP